ncbi:CLIP domain-containing serine protease HP8 isoform X2 [Halyomorpha halys]|nr:CLIP domain-containing serine protease 2 isoform X2 [Halyomorpha halys]XP_014284191.1 CLIP domain-containing serine protease 2 isoform X2 [Halyomorpha halys]
MEKTYFLCIICFGSLLIVCDSYLTADEKNKFVPENHKNWNNLDHRSCGFSWKNRIIGGKSVQLGKYPWLVRVGKTLTGPGWLKTADRITFPCAGVILNRFFILTAGHCFLDQKVIPTLVRAGEYDTSKETDCVGVYCAAPVQDVTIRTYYTPRQFKPDSMENDIALIQLQTPIEFSDTVQPICLPPFSISSKNWTNKVTEVAGWGLINIYTRKTPCVLQAVSLKIVENAWCKMYKEKHNKYPFNIICAGTEQGKDSCSGDSGGPLMLPVNEEGSNKYYVIGVVSYGPEACGETSSPGIYTYVPQFQQWLLNLITMK